MPRSISYGEVVQSLEPLSNWSRFFVHPFSGRVLWVLANYAPVHPNLLTLVSGLLGAGAAFFFLQGDAAGWYAGAVFYYLSFALDTIDGSLARLTGKTSALGAYLDVVVDFVRSAALCTALSLSLIHI